MQFHRKTATLFGNRNKNSKAVLVITSTALSYKVKKDAPQDAQLAEWNLIATQHRSRAEIAYLRNLFYIYFTSSNLLIAEKIALTEALVIFELTPTP